MTINLEKTAVTDISDNSRVNPEYSILYIMQLGLFSAADMWIWTEKYVRAMTHLYCNFLQISSVVASQGITYAGVLEPEFYEKRFPPCKNKRVI